jgi:hypothetical protein
MIRRALRQLAKWLLKATEPGTLNTTLMGCRLWSFDDAGVSTWGAPVTDAEIEQITRHVLDRGYARLDVSEYPAGAAIPYNPAHGTPVAAVVEASAELETLPMPRPRRPIIHRPAERTPPELAGTGDTEVRSPDLAGAIAARTEKDWSHPGHWPRTRDQIDAVVADVRERTGPGKGKKFCGCCGTRTGAGTKKCSECGYEFPRKRQGITVGAADVE